MDESEIIFIDDDERNARDTRTDHRVRPGGFARPLPAPRRRRVVISGAGREPVVVREASAAEPVAYSDRRLFGNLTASEAVEAGAQVVATLMQLPAPPVATGKVEIDVENLTLYNAALAMHAKRDEQLRTVGSLLAKLMS